MSLETSEIIRSLQRKLYRKAKAEPAKLLGNSEDCGGGSCRVSEPQAGQASESAAGEAVSPCDTWGASGGAVTGASLMRAPSPARGRRALRRCLRQSGCQRRGRLSGCAGEPPLPGQSVCDDRLQIIKAGAPWQETPNLGVIRNRNRNVAGAPRTCAHREVAVDFVKRDLTARPWRRRRLCHR